MHKNTQIPLYERLGSKQRLAVDLRLLGYTYSRIATNSQIDLKENTIRSWFTQKGVCYMAYSDLQKQKLAEREDLFRNITIQLIDGAYDAVKVLVEAVKKGNVTACIKIIEIAGIDSNFMLRMSNSDDNEVLTLLKRLIEKGEEDYKRQEKVKKSPKN